MKFFLVIILCTSNFLAGWSQQKQLTAEKIMYDAYQQAAKENKHVFVIFHASWCIWCHKMERAMDDTAYKNLFDENYVQVRLNVDEILNAKLETPGAAAFMKKFHGEAAGLPFWLILDKNGKFLADSYIRRAGVSMDVGGDNMGCPVRDKEVTEFSKILRQTSRLSDADILKIAQKFRSIK